jgi:hypothetical protein
MIRISKIFFLLSILSFGFFGCKKYPENKLIFRDPETCFKGGKITMYTIGGVDHLKDITDLYETFPYNYYGKKIDNVLDVQFNYNKGDNTISCDYGDGTFEFSRSKKDILISFKPLNHEYGAQNIFIADANWKILKLTKSGQLKIQAYINARMYAIQFN